MLLPTSVRLGLLDPQAHVGGVLLSSKLLEIPELEEKSILMCLPGPRKMLSGLGMPEPCLAPWRKTSLVLGEQESHHVGTESFQSSLE